MELNVLASDNLSWALLTTSQKMLLATCSLHVQPPVLPLAVSPPSYNTLQLVQCVPHCTGHWLSGPATKL